MVFVMHIPLEFSPNRTISWKNPNPTREAEVIAGKSQDYKTLQIRDSQLSTVNAIPVKKQQFRS
ncbi:hypothetical protein FRX31_025993 [Thalictrum thalictroides]|uniref:Uncharacterized protein n=1 Tax=Thalictrum thalictroides TaxID=46969 RepID=A0A7J6VI89_THATH|nr:hypothetical protein FRX31_025993 [Thalictrum thalictroides]